MLPRPPCTLQAPLLMPLLLPLPLCVQFHAWFARQSTVGKAARAMPQRMPQLPPPGLQAPGQPVASLLSRGLLCYLAPRLVAPACLPPSALSRPPKPWPAAPRSDRRL